MTEREAESWLTSWKRGWETDDAVSPALKSHLNELYRILYVFMCPAIHASAEQELNEFYRQRKAVEQFDDSIPGAQRPGCE